MNKKKRSKEVKTLTSLVDLRAEFGLPPLRMQTRDKEKLKGQRENFKNRHKCPVCGTTMEYVEGTNMMQCPNKECKGFTVTLSVDEETGETITCNMPSYEILDDKGAVIARNIFAELD